MSGIPSRLRIAVVASGAAAQTRLAALVAPSGHEVVELTAAPDAVLTDGTIDSSAPAPTVTIGSVEGDFAGWLPPDATPEQIDAALRAVAAGLIVRGPSRKAAPSDHWPRRRGRS